MDVRIDKASLEGIYDREARDAGGSTPHLAKIMRLVLEVARVEEVTTFAQLADVLESTVLAPLGDLVVGLRREADGNDSCRGSNIDVEPSADAEDTGFPDAPPLPVDERAARTIYVSPRNPDDHPVMCIEDVSGWKDALLIPTDEPPKAACYVHAHHACRIEVQGIASEAVSIFGCEDIHEANRVAAFCQETGAFYKIAVGSEPPSVFPNQLRFLGKIPQHLK